MSTNPQIKLTILAFAYRQPETVFVPQMCVPQMFVPQMFVPQMFVDTYFIFHEL